MPGRGGGPCPSGLRATASLLQSLPRMNCLPSPCLCFPPLLYHGPFAPNGLIPGKSKALVRPVGKRRAGCRDPRGVGGIPSPTLRPSRDASRRREIKSPFPQPTPAWDHRRPIPPSGPPSPQGTGGLGGSTHSKNPLARVSQAFFFPSLVPPPLPGRRSSMAGGGGRPRRGVEEAQAEEDADIGRQPG